MAVVRNEAELRRALGALHAGDHAVALEAAVALLAANPADPSLCQLAALAALKAGHAREASMLARRSLALEPGHGPTLLLYGRAARDDGDAAEAAAAFRQAAEAMPGVPEPLFLLCAMLLVAGHPEGRMLLGVLADRFPRDSEGWADMARILAEERPDVALLCLDQAERIAPSADLARCREMALDALGREGEAATACRDAMGLVAAPLPDLSTSRRRGPHPAEADGSEELTWVSLGLRRSFVA